MATQSTATYLQLDTPTHGCVPGHSGEGNGMEHRTWIIFILSWAALLYALWIGSRMVTDDVVFNP